MLCGNIIMTHFSRKHHFQKSHVGIISLIFSLSSLLFSLKNMYISDMAITDSTFLPPFATLKQDLDAWLAFLLLLRV